MKKFFISYSRSDGGDFARHISEHYEKEGVEVCVDSDAIGIGEDWNNKIKNAIAESDVVISQVPQLMSYHFNYHV